MNWSYHSSLMDEPLLRVECANQYKCHKCWEFAGCMTQFHRWITVISITNHYKLLHMYIFLSTKLFWNSNLIWNLVDRFGWCTLRPVVHGIYRVPTIHWNRTRVWKLPIIQNVSVIFLTAVDSLVSQSWSGIVYNITTNSRGGPVSVSVSVPIPEITGRKYQYQQSH